MIPHTVHLILKSKGEVTMPEYIERDKLVGKFLDNQISGTSSKIDIAEAIRFVNSMPADNVVEVVRCKDVDDLVDRLVGESNDT